MNSLALRVGQCFYDGPPAFPHKDVQKASQFGLGTLVCQPQCHPESRCQCTTLLKCPWRTLTYQKLSPNKASDQYDLLNSVCLWGGGNEKNGVFWHWCMYLMSHRQQNAIGIVNGTGLMWMWALSHVMTSQTGLQEEELTFLKWSNLLLLLIQLQLAANIRSKNFI